MVRGHRCESQLREAELRIHTVQFGLIHRTGMP